MLGIDDDSQEVVEGTSFPPLNLTINLNRDDFNSIAQECQGWTIPGILSAGVVAGFAAALGFSYPLLPDIIFGGNQG
jgi:hypothetical protein